MKKRHDAFSYNPVCDTIACRIVRFCHIERKYNPADVLSKQISCCEWFELIKPLIFRTWHDDSDPKNGEDKGSLLNRTHHISMCHTRMSHISG